MHTNEFYIDGRWVAPHARREGSVVDPASEREIARIALGDAADVDAAVTAARRAFASYSQTSREERVALLERILAEYRLRAEEIGLTIAREIGAPVRFAIDSQSGLVIQHLTKHIEVLKNFWFGIYKGTTRVAWPSGSTAARSCRRPSGPG